MSAAQPTDIVRHSKFYLDDRKPFVTLLVERQLFRVHRYFFEIESQVFKTMFEIPQGDSSAEGEADESPIVLPSVSVPEMEALLKFFYFRQGLEEEKFSKDDWCSLLSISHRYECERARERSIKEINKFRLPVDNVDKIAMAKKFGVEEWLVPNCVALVEREAPLTHVEAVKLGLDMTVLLSEARERYTQQQQSETYNQHGRGANSGGDYDWNGEVDSWNQRASGTPDSWGQYEQQDGSNSWGGQQRKKPNPRSKRANGTPDPRGKQPSKNATQLVKEVLHIK